MDIWIIFGILAYCFACGGFASYVAKTKKYNDGIWFLLGLLFGILALIAITGAKEKA